ncbi:tetratricopeptide repeat protein [Micromonospora parva]|uniref:tetratricopeptide repeat protein n=1 Tax=Micromonospora parva TaxID=1464048 RepID=UPI0037131170
MTVGSGDGRRSARLVAVLTGLSAALVAMLAISTNLATGAIPGPLQRWTNDPAWTWGTTAVLLVVVVVVAVLLVCAPASAEKAEDLTLRLPTVRDVNPLVLGIKPAVAADADGLPPYVSRDGDDDLEWALAEGGIVLLHGQAAAGKSRSAYEALLRCRPDHRLLVPPRPEALPRLGTILPADEGVVIWLDDLEQYLVPLGLDEGVLAELTPDGRRDVVIVATIRDEELARLQRAHLQGSAPAEVRAAGRLIAQIDARRRVAVGRYLSTTERGAITDPDADPRVAAALVSSFGFAEYLAAGPGMMSRWSTGDSPLFEVGQAVISVAIDCRRAGCRDPLPVSMFDRLHRQYVSPAWRERPDLPPVDSALAWACEPVLGASSCLLPRTGPAYLVSDYLLDRAAMGEGPLAGRPVPDEVWQAVLEASDSRQAVKVAFAASASDRRDVEEEALRQAAGSDDPMFQGLYAAFLHGRGRDDEAVDRYRQALASSITCPDIIRMNYVSLLLDRDEEAEAEQVLRAFAERDATAAEALGRLLVRRDATEEGERWLRAATTEGIVTAMAELGATLAVHGDRCEAELWLRRAAEKDDLGALVNLGILLADHGDDTGAEAMFRRAVELGDYKPLPNLVNLMIERGAAHEAEELIRPAVDDGNAAAMSCYGALLLMRGADDGLEWLRRAADQGDPTAAGNLGLRLVEQGRPAEAVPLLERSVGADIAQFRAVLGAVLADRGEVERAQPHLRAAAEGGSDDAAANLGLMLAGRGEDEEAERWLRIAAEANNIRGLAALGAFLALRGDTSEAAVFLHRAAVAGSATAAANLGGLLIVAGEFDEAEIWCRRSAEAGDPHGERNLATLAEARRRAPDP